MASIRASEACERKVLELSVASDAARLMRESWDKSSACHRGTTRTHYEWSAKTNAEKFDFGGQCARSPVWKVSRTERRRRPVWSTGCVSILQVCWLQGACCSRAGQSPTSCEHTDTQHRRFLLRHLNAYVSFAHVKLWKGRLARFYIYIYLHTPYVGTRFLFNWIKTKPKPYDMSRLILGTVSGIMFQHSEYWLKQTSSFFFKKIIIISIYLSLSFFFFRDKSLLCKEVNNHKPYLRRRKQLVTLPSATMLVRLECSSPLFPFCLRFLIAY